MESAMSVTPITENRREEAIRLINLALGMVDDRANVAAVHLELAIDALTRLELSQPAETLYRVENEIAAG